jgi:hypothetical protein
VSQPTARPGQDLNAVRSEVRSLLEKSQAFGNLPPEDRKSMANAMVRVGQFLADPDWIDAPVAPEVKALAEPGEDKDPVTSLKERLADKPGQVGDGFKAGGVREGVQQFGELVKKVDFPAFVSGLVNGVFKAVVDASMDQMKAYAELLSAVAKTVDQFAADNFTDAMARDHIKNRYPSAVRIETTEEGGSRLRPGTVTEGVDLAADFKMTKTVDLDDDESELQLVTAAKLEMARSRQQLLATMVLLGINRIVITDGRINAKVVFDMRADDMARRKAHAQMNDEVRSSQETGAAAAAWSPWGGAGAYHRNQSSHVATVESAVDDTSQSSAEVKAQLTGDVQLRFKSETFPLERMVDAGGLVTLQQRAQPGAAPPAATPAPGAPTGAK